MFLIKFPASTFTVAAQECSYNRFISVIFYKNYVKYINILFLMADSKPEMLQAR